MTLTLAQVKHAYLTHLKEKGKSKPTLRAYQSDLEVLCSFIKGDTPIRSLTPLLMGRFFKSNTLKIVKDTGVERAQVSQERIIRVVRQYLIWAYSQQMIETLPLPKSISRGRSNLQRETNQTRVN